MNIDKLKIQIQKLPDLLKSYNQSNPSQTINSVTSLTMPITSATVERTFSTIRSLKNFLGQL